MNTKNEKYFNESGGGHYDARYFKNEIGMQNKTIVLRKLLTEFTQLCNANAIRVIVMHGSLLGWYFNQRMLPWDDDMDVCVSYHDLTQLNSYMNSHIHLDINPHFVNRNTRNKTHTDNHEMNKIDARFICKKTGLYIDITALYPDSKRRDLLSTKCPHVYKYDDIYPLTHSTFEKCNIYVPHHVENVLSQEYGVQFIQQKQSPEHTYKGFAFDRGEWIQI